MNSEPVLFRLFGTFCPEGTILYTEGAPGQELYVIQSGAVRLGAARPEGRPAPLLGPGDLLGEGSFFGRAPRSDRAEVVKDARLIQVSDRTLDAVVRNGPGTAQLIFEKLLALTKGVSGELDSLNCARVMRRLAPSLTADSRGGIAPAELAEHSGLPESDVLTVLEEFVQRGCLVCEGQVFRAPDAALLQREIDAIAAAGESA